MQPRFVLGVLVLVLASVQAACPGRGHDTATGPGDPADAPIDATAVAAAKQRLLETHGDAHRARIERGVDQVATLWRTSDGDLAAFCAGQFLAAPVNAEPLLEATARALVGGK